MKGEESRIEDPGFTPLFAAARFGTGDSGRVQILFEAVPVFWVWV